MTDKVYLLTLKTGERVITKVVDGIATFPMILVPDEKRRVMFIPYLQFAEEEGVPFEEMQVVHVLTPISDLIDSFLSHISPIAVPSSAIIQ